MYNNKEPIINSDFTALDGFRVLMSFKKSFIHLFILLETRNFKVSHIESDVQLHAQLPHLG